jgi:imidazolonepropionase-like amidohydrolase
VRILPFNRTNELRRLSKMATEKHRWHLSRLVCIPLFVFVVMPLAALAQTRGTTAIVGGQLIDGHGGPPVHRSVVIIEGSKIKTVGREGETPIPAGAKVIDAHAKTVMPGLIDMHVHLVLLGGGVPYPLWMWGTDWKGPNRTLEIMKISAHELLMHGVTTVRDLGGDTKLSVDYRDAINAGKEVGPRLFVSGAFISRACNYAAQPAFCTQIKSPEEAVAAANQRIAAGADWVKAWGLQPADIRALAEATHLGGKRVAAHWVGSLLQDYGLGPGDSVEHSQPLTPTVMDKIAQSGVWVVPTLMTSGAYQLTEQFPERLDDPEFKKDVPADLYKMMYDYSVNFQRLNYFATVHSRLKLTPDTMRQMVNSSFAGRLLVGTDAGTALNFNTDTTREELKLFVKWGGMAPLDAISAATRLSAQALGRVDEFGAVDPGKYADVIVIDGNPLEDMAVLKNVVHVIKEGVQYK